MGADDVWTFQCITTRDFETTDASGDDIVLSAQDAVPVVISVTDENSKTGSINFDGDVLAVTYEVAVVDDSTDDMDDVEDDMEEDMDDVDWEEDMEEEIMGDNAFYLQASATLMAVATALYI